MAASISEYEIVWSERSSSWGWKFDGRGSWGYADEYAARQGAIFDKIDRTVEKEFRLVSAKRNRDFTGTRRSAERAAIDMDVELQPAFGVTLCDSDGNTLAEIRDGEIEA